MNRNIKTALVFGGGGAKGSFQLGVWKALEELDVDISIITGASVGALNAVLFIQGDREIAENMWREIELNNILAMQTPDTEDKGKIAKEIIKESIIKQGISTEPLQRLIQKSVTNESRIRESSIKLGITVTNFNSFRTEYYKLDDIPDGELAHYLLASASFFPAMKKVKIREQFYIDGGVKDNIPIEFAAELGGETFLVVDVQGPGRSKSIPPSLKEKTTYIQTPWDLGDFLFFDRDRTNLNIEIGYLEAIKVLSDNFIGKWYTFNKNDWIDEKNNFYHFIAKRLLSSHPAYKHPIFSDEALQIHIFKRAKEEWGSRINGETLPLAILEMLGKVNYMYPNKAYSFETFRKELKEKIKNDKDNTTAKSQFEEELFMDWKFKAKQKMSLPLDVELIEKVYQALFLEGDNDWLKRIEWLIILKPTIVVCAFYLDYLFST